MLLIKFRLWLALTVLGLVVLGATQWIGSSISEDGMLTEPFALMVIGRGLVLIGVVGMLVSLLIKFVSKTPE